MKRMTLMGVLLGLGGILGLIACSQTPQVAGTTSETTNGDLQASVLKSDGTPAARVRVLLVDDEDWLGKVAEGSSVNLDSVITNDSGKFTLHLPAAHRCNLQVDAESEGAFIRGITSQVATGTAANSRKIILAPFGGISGQIHSDIGTVREIRLAGSAYTGIINPDSSYAFFKIAQGSFAIVAMVTRGGVPQPFLTNSLDVTSGVTLVNQDLGVSASRLLVDDFELGWKQTALGRILGEGLWYTATDIGEKGTSTIKVDYISDSTAYSGSCVRAEYALGTTKRVTAPWAVMGFNIGTSLQGTVYDFSNLTAISFWAKGKGIIDVRFLSKTISRQFTDSAQYFFPLQLNPVWTHITIPVDSLRLPPNTQPDLRLITWPMAAKEMQTLDFTLEWPAPPGDSADFWVDDIYFEGLSLKDLVH